LAPLKRHYHLAAPDWLRRRVNAVRRRGSANPPAATPQLQLADGSVPVLQGAIDWHPAIRYRHHWPNLPWFALPTFSDGHVRLNLQGRERTGIVPFEDYGRTCDRLETLLRQAIDPRTGEPVVDDVIRIRAHDPMAPDGPTADLVVTWRHPVDALEHPTAGVVGPFAFPRSGTHTPDGFVIAAGAGVGQGAAGDHRVLDVGPTLRALLGWDPRPDLAGTVIPQIAGRPVAPRP
jgi:hypothetical protein